jgi:cytoskeletal protein CcmA (bactofilin family)
VAIVLLLLVSPLGAAVAAAQSSGGPAGAVVVEQGETVDSIDSVAGAIVVRGTVAGDLSGVAGSIRITETGHVRGTVDASAGSVIIDGTVDGDTRIGAGSFDVTDSARIGGDLDVGAGYVRVDGAVDGDVRAGGGSVSLGPNANVGGEFRYDAEEFARDPDAVIDGGVVRDSNLRGDGEIGAVDSVLPSWVGGAYSLAASLLFGVVLLAAFPRFSSGVATRALEAPVRSGGIGFGALIAAPIALVLIAVTIVGIPIALAGIGLFALAVWAAVVYGKYAVGTWAIGLVDRDNRWVALVVGLVGFAVLGSVPILGGLLEFAVFLLGLGALAVNLRESYRTESTTGRVDAQ